MELGNNFQAYKPAFKKDTGLDANANMALYISYFNARASDNAMQLTAQIYQIIDRSDGQHVRDMQAINKAIRELHELIKTKK
ncbi:MAG: hypothetical protein FD123_952 [Bacteroidetes bacterium]|nr:MAG: hypothetical protein FD123_952 [Bacteroidota bacterium]